MHIGVGFPPLAGRSGPAVVGSLLLTLVCIWLVFAGIAYDLYKAEWRNQEIFGSNLAALLDQNIARNVQLLDISIAAAADESENAAVAALPVELRQKVYFERSLNPAGLGTLLVLDKNGVLVASSTDASPDHLNLSDRDYFQAQRDGRVLSQPFVSKPFRSRISHDLVVGFSRPRTSKSGSFDGVAVGAMRLSYFSRLFELIHLPHNSTIMLVRSDGTVLMRAPQIDDEIGRVVPWAGFRMAGRTPAAGSYVKASIFDNVERLFSYRRVGDLPVYVTVGLSTHEFLSQYLLRIGVIGLGFVVLTLVIGHLAVGLAQRLRRRIDSERSLHRLASTDALTLLANRRLFDETLHAEWSRAANEETSLSLIMIDGDYFKAYNDTYGHPRGDDVLRRLAAALVTCVSRPGDLVARFGGEEFVILLPRTEPSGAMAIAMAVKHAVEALAIPNAGSPFDHVTVSVGIATRMPSIAASASILLEAADRALYAAKADGRDRIRVEGEQSPDQPVTQVA